MLRRPPLATIRNGPIEPRSAALPTSAKTGNPMGVDPRTAEKWRESMPSETSAPLICCRPAFCVPPLPKRDAVEDAGVPASSSTAAALSRNRAE